MWAKVQSASWPRSMRTWGPESQLCGWAAKSLARSWSWANSFQRMRQCRSRGAILKGPKGPKESKGCGRWVKRKEEGWCAAGRLLVRETKRESYRCTATRSKTKFYSYSHTHTTRMTIFDCHLCDTDCRERRLEEMWAKARSASWPRSMRTWGPESQLHSPNARMARCDEMALGSQVLGGLYSQEYN